MKNEAKYGEGSSRFTRSVNLEQDAARQGALAGYIVTSGVRRALLRVAVPSDDGILRRAITLTGPYGTGKSAFAVFCTQLLAPKWWPNHKAASELIHAADVALADQIVSTKGPPPSLLPVVVTGSREPLATAVVRALIRSFQVVNEDRCKNHERHLRKLLRQAEDGQALSSRTICEALSDSLALADCGRRSFHGISLVLDELGKFLEYAAAHPTESDVYVLQAIAELSVRSDRPFLVLSVLHQDFSAYVDRLGAKERSEWEKVRGRFEDFAFEEPADEILRLLAHARAQAQELPSKERAHSKRIIGQSKTQRQLGTLAKNAAKLGLAPTCISQNEFVQILNTCRPLHPIVSVMLGPLFRKLAQNERSVFSFLDSVEPNGLRDFVSRTSGRPDELYRTDRLYDYIIASVGTGLYTHGLRKRWAEIDAVLTRLPQATDLDVFLIKTIGILGAIGQWRNLRASREVLCFAASGLAAR